MSDYIAHDHQDDGIDRKGFLTCMAWAGTGVLWTLSGGRAAANIKHHGHFGCTKERADGGLMDFVSCQACEKMFLHINETIEQHLLLGTQWLE